MTTEAAMQCPKCGGDFETRKVAEEIEVEQCNHCRGLLVPAGTTHKLMEIWGPDTSVDSGSETVGKKYDRVDDIDCPKCKVKMDKIEDIHQPHIWMENCAVCGSTFFDAGELTDLKEKSVSDFFKKFLKGRREA